MTEDLDLWLVDLHLLCGGQEVVGLETLEGGVKVLSVFGESPREDDDVVKVGDRE